MSGEVRFTSAGARRPSDLGMEGGLGDPLWFWANNLPTDKRGTSFSGWVCEIRQEPNEFDRVMENHEQPRVTIVHTGGKKKQYWAMEEAHLHVIALGVPEQQELREPTGHRYGIRYWWGDRNGRSGSNLQFRAVVHNLAWRTPCVFSVKGMLTTVMLKILRDHYRTLDAMDTMRGHEHPFFMAAIPVGIGDDTIAAKSRTTGDSSDVVPPVSLIPKDIDDAFIKSVWIGSQTLVDICENELDRTVNWSMTVPVVPTSVPVEEYENAA